jgi:hypothetical protein
MKLSTSLAIIAGLGLVGFISYYNFGPGKSSACQDILEESESSFLAKINLINKDLSVSLDKKAVDNLSENLKLTSMGLKSCCTGLESGKLSSDSYLECKSSGEEYNKQLNLILTNSKSSEDVERSLQEVRKISNNIKSISSRNEKVNPKLTDILPEFDGGYIKNNDNKFNELKEKNISSTQIVKGSISISALMRLPKTYYVSDKEGIIQLSKSDFAGLAVRGKYSFEHFSLHPLVTKNLADNESLFENKGSAKKGKPFYIPGEKLELRSKKLSEDTYYFTPRHELEKGEYVGWIGRSFWLFEIK